MDAWRTRPRRVPGGVIAMRLTKRTKVLLVILLWLVTLALFVGSLCCVNSPWSWL